MPPSRCRVLCTIHVSEAGVARTRARSDSCTRTPHARVPLARVARCSQVAVLGQPSALRTDRLAWTPSRLRTVEGDNIERNRHEDMERTLTKHFNLRQLTIAVVVLASVLLVACTGGDGAGEGAGTSGSPARAPSLESASSPNGATIASSTGAVDAPVFPDVVVTEGISDPPRIVPEDLKVVWEAWELLQEDYVDRSKLDPEAFTEFAIRGMLTVLGDPQTSYVSPTVLKSQFRDVFQGEFEGIGAYVHMNLAGKLIIVAPIAGSPAEAAGIRPGDIVLAVDGESLEGLGVLEAVAKIRGPKGSTATLLVKHLGASDPVEIAVKRGLIPLESVRLRSEPGAVLAHIRVTDFYPNTVDHLREMITKAVDDGAKGLILDLRSNGGGLLHSAVDVASQFLQEGLVVYVVEGSGRRTDYRVREGGIATDIPMVVLVNGGSASGSEILAGALQDHQRAKVIGTTTFGKGSVNWLRDLSNGGGLYITIAHCYTPLGRLIQPEGIEPDITVTDRDQTEADIKQLRRAIVELEQMTGVGQAEGLGS